MDIFIYALRRVGDWEFRYVGQTMNPGSRMANHLSTNKASARRKDVWIKAILDSGDSVEMVILAKVEEDNATQFESRFYHLLKKAGHRLLNAQRPNPVNGRGHKRGYQRRKKRMSKRQRQIALRQYLSAQQEREASADIQSINMDDAMRWWWRQITQLDESSVEDMNDV